MKKEYEDIFNKVTEIIKTNGIPHYLKIWKPYKIKNKYSSKNEFIKDLAEYINSYHSHSTLFYKNNFIPTNYHMKIYKESSKISLKYLTKRKMPDFFFTNKIGKITFYQYTHTDENHKDFKHFVNLVKNHLKEWEKNGIKGLILDFRHNLGGSIFPLYSAFSDLFNNSSIYGLKNTKAHKSDQIWINVVNGKIIHCQKFLSSKLNYNYPIAVLIGKDTSSSGELGAIMFYKRNAKFFGEPTNGALSVNKTISVNKDITINITESLINTVNGKFHITEKIYPDVTTTQPISEARKWIKNKLKQIKTN